jgi:DNA-damage-inducible protein D
MSVPINLAKLVFVEEAPLLKNMNQNPAPIPAFDDFTIVGEVADAAKTWWASDLAQMLGYNDITSFAKTIRRAMGACLSANIDCSDEFSKTKRVVDGNVVDDFKLTRFACYMVVMNGDSKKPQVARAQVYFAQQAEQFDLILEGKNDVERIIARAEITDGNKSLNAAAAASGVTNFAIFNDAGYRGLYNMGIKQVTVKKGVANGTLLDHMGRTELAANLFRITLTEDRLKMTNVKGENNACLVHRSVGKGVRDMVRDNTGMYPEDLPVERKLGEVQRQLKKANKQLNK